MRIVHKTILVVILLLLIEILYIHVDPVSFGFPFRSVEYKSEDITGTSRSWLGEEQTFGFNVEPILLISDVLVLFFLALLLIKCIPSAAFMPVVQGCVLGSVTGAAIYWFDEMLSGARLYMSILSVIVLVGVPVIIYMLSLRHKWQKTVILIISFTTLITFGRSFLFVESLSDGVDEEFFSLERIPSFLALTLVLACGCFVLMLLHKKVLPILLRKKQLNSLPESIEYNFATKVIRSPEQAEKKSRIKSSILYVLLLFITVYIGHHFMTVRKMRHDDFFISDVIESELEHLEVPLKGQILLIKFSSESFEDGWNVSCRAEVEVKDENMYDAKIMKHMLVPWVHVEIYKKENATKTDSRRNSGE